MLDLGLKQIDGMAIKNKRKEIMTEQTNQSTWKAYQDAWADIASDERQRLLHASLAPECTFSSPTGEGRGYGDLTANIENFQKTYPGASFRTHTFVEHHGQALANWTVYDKTGAEFLSGSSYARFAGDGILTQLVGFWQS